MQTDVDLDHFDQLQSHVLKALLTSIRSGLLEAGVTDDQMLYEATGIIGFSVAAIIDGSHPMAHQGKPVIPFLAFRNERNGDQLCIAERGSWMHEYVANTVDDVFAEADDNCRPAT